ncbi:hypothetical protein PybrP1_003259 [[Pythium] brassicae (nom. inval.)]|nr:hypothetical protein PybrP1_003259 [[Pythium] brassicae (nom. inval.)]
MAAATTTRTVLVTGASRGIGLKFVDLYAQDGWNVIGAARDPSEAEQLKALSPYKIVQLDVSNEESILRAAKELEGEAIDLLINNASIFSNNGSATTPKLDMTQQFEINAVGPFLVTREFVPNLKAAAAARGTATVAQITSGLSSITNNSPEGYFGYRASKAGLNMVTASLAADLKSDGIIAATLSPGFVATDMNRHAGAVTTTASVSGLMAAIAGLSLERSGVFLNYDGQPLPW